MASLHCCTLFYLCCQKRPGILKMVHSWFPPSVISIPSAQRLLPQVYPLCCVCQPLFSNKCHCLLPCFELEHIPVSPHIQLKAALYWFNSPLFSMTTVTMRDVHPNFQLLHNCHWAEIQVVWHSIWLGINSHWLILSSACLAFEMPGIC